MTPGPWGLRGYQIRADNGLGRHVASYMTDAEDGRVLAASRELLGACEALLGCFVEGSKLSDSLIREETDAIRAAVAKARSPR